MNDNAVELSDVVFSYASAPARARALDDVSLKIRRGEFVALMGRTGCGKTTLLLTINGVIPKTIGGAFAGRVRVFGADVAQHSVAQMSERVAFVFQDANDQLFCETAREEIAFGLRLRGASENEISKRVSESLGAVGLRGFEERDPFSLSQGQKQKLCLATAIASGAPVLALDEPIASLDYENAQHVYEILSSLKRSGKTIIAVEHDAEFAAKHADRVVIIEGGKIAENGDASLLKSARIERYGIKRLK